MRPADVEEREALRRGSTSVPGSSRQTGERAGGHCLELDEEPRAVFLDRRLSLPEEEGIWVGARRREARVPQEVQFEAKTEQAMAMLVHGWRAKGADAMGDGK